MMRLNGSENLTFTFQKPLYAADYKQVILSCCDKV